MFRKRTKRTTIKRINNNLFVEYLIAIDSSVYNIFSSLYGNLDRSLMANYINIFFAQVVNGVIYLLIKTI